MGFEENLKSMRVSSAHKRSKSETEKQEDNLDISPESPHHFHLKEMGEQKGFSEQKKQSNDMEQNSLKKQEIFQLEKKLQDQFVVRTALEEALGQRYSSHNTSQEKSMPKPAEDLIKQIAVLELEVAHLEQYLLTLYRKAFNQQIQCASDPKKDAKFESPPDNKKSMGPKISGLGKTLRKDQLVFHSSRLHVPRDSLATPQKEINGSMLNDMLLDSGIHRSHSSLSHRSTYEIRNSSPTENQAKGIWSYYSQPLSSHEYAPSATSGLVSLAEQLGTCETENSYDEANRISEDMIKCMSAIYCKVSDPSITHHGLSSSPNSSLLSEGIFSPEDQYDIWSPYGKKDSRLDNPFNIEGLKEYSGPYRRMAEVPWICRDSKRLKAIDDTLQKYKSLVRQLEKVDIRKLKHKEKLAFWINIHNALAMHALLVYGIPQNNEKRISLILKAAYNVGGHTISADTIQSSILGCRMPRPVQWLRILFTPKTKLKPGDSRQSYAIEHPEPLLHFALCSGSYSDPAIRVYTPKKVFQELEVAKEEYIRATLGVRKEQKMLLPKIVESFAKDSALCPAGVVEMIQQSIPETLRNSVRSFPGKLKKTMEWVPHNFAFRYLISNDLVK